MDSLEKTPPEPSAELVMMTRSVRRPEAGCDRDRRETKR
jgi:hypothetical protein